MNQFLTTLLAFSILNVFAISDPNRPIIQKHINESINKKNSDVNFIIKNVVPGSNNVQHYYGIQHLDGYEIFGTNFNISIRKGEVVSYNQKFLVNPNSIAKTTDRLLSAADAIQILVQDIPISKNEVKQVSKSQYNYVNYSLSDEIIKVNQMWYLDNKKLIPVFEVSLYEKDHLHWYNTRINAVTGKIINQNDWVTHCNINPTISIASSAPKKTQVAMKQKKTGSSSYNVFARPLESPNHGNRTIEVDPEDADASPYGWHDINGAAGGEYTITRGNNVYASEDKNNDNSPGNSPDGGNNLTFNDDFDITKSASLYTDAAVTNLFFWNNLMHDIWWHYGFDESSGNFQQNNYSNGGVGSDFVNADAQDGSGNNNANFATPPDGQNPRMQMYLWSASTAGDFFQVNSPSIAAGKYLSNTAQFGPPLTASPVKGNLVLVNDGTANPEKGCSNLINGAAVSGNIAFLERGDCNFTVKVKNAQNAGAKAVVIYDNSGNNPITMGGTDASITIPSILIKRTDGLYLKGLLSSQNVNVSLYDSSFASSSTYDSDFDNGVISHEYGHGISVRLTGGPASSGCLSNEEQMGEGWSDFFALVMTTDSSYDGSESRGIGTYVQGNPTTGGGIRTYPYSTSTSVSPYTYNNIKNFSVPHGVGSVWCSMLWDLYWALVDEYGYDSDIYNGTGGNNIAMQLVIDGLKLQPCNPGFVDGRDAILKADQLNNSGDNEMLIWQVFARRGLGYTANQGSTGSRSDGISGFGLPPYLLGELTLEKLASTEIENNKELEYKLVVKNRTLNTIKNLVLRDTLDGNLLLDENSLSCNATYLNSVIEISLDSIASKDSLVCSYIVTPKFDKTSEELWVDDVENGVNNWEVTADQGTGNWVITTNRKNSGANSWFIKNEDVSTDYSLSRSFNLEGKSPILSFAHRYNTEDTWDGGVVEIKSNGGAWEDVDALFVQNGYNAQIQSNPASALSERKAFTGNSKAFIVSKVDLSNYTGSEIEVRFRFASDGAALGEGWYIDDIKIEDAVSVSNYLHVSFGTDKESRVGVNTFITGQGLKASVNEIGLSELSIYPNPTEDFFTVEVKEDVTFKLTVVDVIGKEVLTKQGKGKSTYSLSNLKAGVYTVNVVYNRILYTTKLLKE